MAWQTEAMVVKLLPTLKDKERWIKPGESQVTLCCGGFLRSRPEGTAALQHPLSAAADVKPAQKVLVQVQ